MTRYVRPIVFALTLAVGSLLAMGQTRLMPSRTFTPFMWFGDGTAAAPSITFASNTNRGLFNDTSNSGIGFTVAGTQVGYWNASTLNAVASVTAAGASGHCFSASLGCIKAPADGVFELLNNAGTGFSRLQFGGTTSSFPSIKQTGAGFQFRLADDSAYATINVASLGINTAGSGLFFTSLAASATAPSAPASCGTSPAVTTNNGTTAFVVTGGTGGTATGCTITMPAATTGWNCSITNITQTAAHRADRTTVQTASTTTSVTWEYQTVSTGAATAFTASDVFRGVCFGY